MVVRREWVYTEVGYVSTTLATTSAEIQRSA
jgi:hypothetical protein